MKRKCIFPSTKLLLFFLIFNSCFLNIAIAKNEEKIIKIPADKYIGETLPKREIIIFLSKKWSSLRNKLEMIWTNYKEELQNYFPRDINSDGSVDNLLDVKEISKDYHKKFYDTNNDGRSDSWLYVHKVPKFKRILCGFNIISEPYLVMIDSNYDGRVDLRKYYKNNQVEKTEIDNNYDGKFDQIIENKIVDYNGVWIFSFKIFENPILPLSHSMRNGEKIWKIYQTWKSILINPGKGGIYSKEIYFKTRINENDENKFIISEKSENKKILIIYDGYRTSENDVQGELYLKLNYNSYQLIGKFNLIKISEIPDLKDLSKEMKEIEKNNSNNFYQYLDE